MTIKLRPVQSIRNAVNQIGVAVSASAEFTRAAHQRRVSVDRADAGTSVAPSL